MARKIPDYTKFLGERFGNLTVTAILERAKEYGNSSRFRPRVKVRCDCGTEFPVFLLGLKRGSPKSCRICGYANRRVLSVGDRFDKLEVVGFRTTGRRSEAVCRCDCGNEITIRPYVLQHNQTNNCGCAHRGAWEGEGRLSRTFFYRIQKNADVRKIPFSVTIKELWDLYQKQNGKCALTGLPIDFSFRTVSASTASLDRIDSAGSYSLGNLQWVHKDINLMKMDLPIERFVELCRLVVRQT